MSIIRGVTLAGLLSASVLLLAACSPDGTTPGAAPSESSSSSSSAPQESPSTSTPSETPSDATAQLGTAVLLDDGVGLVDPSTGSITEAVLGGPADAVLRLGEVAFGEPAALDPESCALDDRAAHAWADGFTAYARDGAFIGWTVRPGTPAAGLTTVNGIGLGSTREQVLDAFDVDVQPTSLGEEFVVGSLTGVLDGDAPTSEVIALWGGDGCVAR